MARPKVDTAQRKQSRTVSLSNDEITTLESFGLGSLSAGISTVVVKYLDLVTQYADLNTKLKSLTK